MSRRSEFQQRLEVEEAEWREVLACAQGNPGRRAALKRECERQLRYAQDRFEACKKAADEAVAEFREAIAASEPLPQRVEEHFMAYYILEVEDADDRLKIMRRLLDMADAT